MLVRIVRLQSVFLAIVQLGLVVFDSLGDENNHRASKSHTELIRAAYKLDTAVVESILADSVDLDATVTTSVVDPRFDKPLAPQWTALLAVANSGPILHFVERTDEDGELRRWALRKAKEISYPTDEAQIRRLEITKLLVDKGCSLEVDDGRGMTPLLAAITKGNHAIALLLIELGANVNVATRLEGDGKGKMTPLHLAVHDPQVVAALLRRNCAVNATNGRGDSPLHEAIRRRCLKSVELLVAAGADVHLKNSHGVSPFEDSESQVHFLGDQLARDIHSIVSRRR
ncbi:MAG: ankyrin repeat domain-containing protein [Pirellulales bacterium]